MKPLYKALVIGLFTSILGITSSFVILKFGIEENIDLKMLFKLRGPRNVLPEVIVVSIDKLSAVNLNQPAKPEKWSRSLHARLIGKLVKSGAKVITFDIVFNETRSVSDDNLFASAISKAGNVVLCQSIMKNIVPLSDKSGSDFGELSIERVVPPIQSLAAPSVAVAPFPLPKVPVTVSQYWTFKKSLGGLPTLPVVTFQLFALDEYESFFQLLKKFDPSVINKLPQVKDEIIKNKNLVKIMQVIRGIFENKPYLAERMLGELKNSKTLPGDARKSGILKSLIKMYESPNSQYLNFYGPPRSITTVPFYQVLQIKEKSDTNLEQIDFNNKVVFVGSSESSQMDQKDGFYTVFSQANGLDISGVEIAATAFLNLLEGMPVEPLHFNVYLTTIFLWGMMLGVFCYLFPTVISAVGVVGMGVLYFIVAQYKFKTTGIWCPVIVPLFIQAPLAFFGNIVLKYIYTSRERQNIRNAFRYYLPDEVVDKIAKNISSFKTHSQMVYGTCLATDAEQYTSLAEMMPPDELRSLINRYFETIFRPVKKHRGLVANVLADSMLATWITSQPDSVSRKRACFTALEIDRAVCEFNQIQKVTPLSTRIGLHSGKIILGSVGAGDHYEYRPVGDIVNTVTRIEGLNKYLGTRILLSDEVLKQLDDFMTRELGQFIFIGKSNPLIIHELICRKEDADQNRNSLCELFSDALDAYRKQSWKEATEKFLKLNKSFGEDGPSLFYLRLCDKYKEKQFVESWNNGVVRMDKK